MKKIIPTASNVWIISKFSFCLSVATRVSLLCNSLRSAWVIICLSLLPPESVSCSTTTSNLMTSSNLYKKKHLFIIKTSPQNKLWLRCVGYSSLVFGVGLFKYLEDHWHFYLLFNIVMIPNNAWYVACTIQKMLSNVIWRYFLPVNSTKIATLPFITYEKISLSAILYH